MNIRYFIKAAIQTLWQALLFGILMAVAILSVFLVLPFCRKENTIDAGSEWFAWYPVVLGSQENIEIRRIRWLVTVSRVFNDGFIYYEKEKV